MLILKAQIKKTINFHENKFSSHTNLGLHQRLSERRELNMIYTVAQIDRVWKGGEDNPLNICFTNMHIVLSHIEITDLRPSFTFFILGGV